MAATATVTVTTKVTFSKVRKQFSVDLANENVPSMYIHRMCFEAGEAV